MNYNSRSAETALPLNTVYHLCPDFFFIFIVDGNTGLIRSPVNHHLGKQTCHAVKPRTCCTLLTKASDHVGLQQFLCTLFCHVNNVSRTQIITTNPS